MTAVISSDEPILTKRSVPGPVISGKNPARLTVRRSTRAPVHPSCVLLYTSLRQFTSEECNFADRVDAGIREFGAFDNKVLPKEQGLLIG